MAPDRKRTTAWRSSRRIEVEARRNAEAFQGGAQGGHVDFGGAHDDAHLAEGASRGGLHQNAARDLFDFALDAGGLDERDARDGCGGQVGALR